MTLIEKQQQIYELVQRILSDSKTALTLKGVVVPSNITLDQLPVFIQLIAQSDYEFFMNFHLIDSVGSPDIPNTGQSWKDSGITTELLINTNVASWPFLMDKINYDSVFVPNTRFNMDGWPTEQPVWAEPVFDHFDTSKIVFSGFELMQSVPDELHVPEATT